MNDEWKDYLLKKVDAVQQDVSFIKERLIKLETKSTLVSGIIGMIPGALLLVFEFLKRS